MLVLYVNWCVVERDNVIGNGKCLVVCFFCCG